MTDDLRPIDDRRHADRRLADFEKKVDRKFDNVERTVANTAKTVTEIRDMLISEPEASPLGRYLLKRADANQNAIKELAQTNSARIDELQSSVKERRREVDDDIDGLRTDMSGLKEWRAGLEGGIRAARAIQILLTIIVSLLAIYTFFQAVAPQGASTP